MFWRWTARRLLISAFVILHLSATLIWIMPPSAVKQRCHALASRYILPLGLWQCWSMFSPNPFREVLVLEAEVVDSQRLRYRFAFPTIADYPGWGGMARFRHPKFTVNLVSDDEQRPREFAARHAVRRLEIPAAAYPLEVHLYYKIRPLPPPGSPPDPMTPSRFRTLGTYTFASVGEVWP